MVSSMIRAALILTAMALTACTAPAPECNSINPYHPCHRWADQGAGGMAQAAKSAPAAPGISNNPGGLSGGGPVGGKSPGKGGHKGHGKSKGKK